MYVHSLFTLPLQPIHCPPSSHYIHSQVLHSSLPSTFWEPTELKSQNSCGPDVLAVDLFMMHTSALLFNLTDSQKARTPRLRCVSHVFKSDISLCRIIAGQCIASLKNVNWQLEFANQVAPLPIETLVTTAVY